jgi:hypothetical protein
LKHELLLFQQQVSAAGAAAIKSSSLSMFFNSLSHFLEQVGGDQPNFGKAYTYATAIEVQKDGIIVGKPELPQPPLQPELIQVMREVAALANTFFRLEKPNPDFGSQAHLPVTLKTFTQNILSPTDLRIHREYGALKYFIDKHRRELASSSVPEDRQLKDSVELALSITHDHVKGLGVDKKDLEGILNDILEASDGIASSGGDVVGFPYCYFDGAAVLVETILDQVEAGTPCSSALVDMLGFGSKAATRPAAGGKSPIVSGLIRRLTQ